MPSTPPAITKNHRNVSPCTSRRRVRRVRAATVYTKAIATKDMMARRKPKPSMRGPVSIITADAAIHRHSPTSAPTPGTQMA